MERMESSYKSFIEVEKMLQKIRNTEAWLGDCCVDFLVSLEGGTEFYEHVKCGICGRELYFADRRNNGKEDSRRQTLDSRREEKTSKAKDSHDKQERRKSRHTDGYGEFEPGEGPVFS